MSTRGIAILGTGLLTVVMFASAGSRNNTMRITVLDSETRSLGSDNNGVPSNCDQATFDAYCRSSGTPQMTSTLLVQEGNQAPFRRPDARLSQETPVRTPAQGESFDAKRDKRGLTIYYVDDNGKERKQFYTLVDAGGRITPPRLRPHLQFSQPRPLLRRRRARRRVHRLPRRFRNRSTGAKFTSPHCCSAASSCAERSGAEHAGKSAVQFHFDPARCGYHDRRQLCGEHAIRNQPNHRQARRSNCPGGLWRVEAGADGHFGFGRECRGEPAEDAAVAGLLCRISLPLPLELDRRMMSRESCRCLVS